VVERADKIARRLDQRAVEIEDKEGRGIHCSGLFASTGAGKRQRVN
jgi:hypothetical protein